MKKSITTLLILPALLLSSCFSFTNKESEEREIKVYDLDNIANNADIEDGYQTTITARFVKGEDYIPYLNPKDYFSLYEPHFKESIISEIEKEGSSIVWTVREGKDYLFVAEFSMSYHAVLIAGSLQPAYRDDDNQQDLEALNYAINTEYTTEDSASSYATYYFSSIDCFKNNGEWYVPLGLLDLIFSGDTDIYYFYNYAHIFSTKSADNFAARSFKDGDNTYTVDSQMKSMVKETTMPYYLRKYNAALFLFLMNNFYGLKEEKGISAMSKFYKTNGIYDDLKSADSATRAQAYADALDIFDDNHTALVSTNDAWGEQDFNPRRLSTGIRSRSILRSTLNTTRDAYYASLYPDQEVEPGDEIVYSQDGKTAMYMFDSFIFTTGDVLNGDDLDRLYKEDSYMNLVHVFEEIKSKGTVKNIILDISTNGGGTVGVMLKLLALLSKDNHTKITYFDSPTGQVVSMICNVDTNQDGEYDEKDVYGNDFNFYILTSDCSFSCGNAFPCVAKLEGNAKIIGQKSGGGECAISIHYLPNSQYVYHSSNLHLGYYDADKNVFTGFEKGATPDIEIKNTSDFYDIEKLNSLITAA